MLALQVERGPLTRSLRNAKTVSPQVAAGLIGPSATVAVGWLSDAFAGALAASFRDRGRPSDLTVVYAATRGLDRVHGLNRLALDGMVRRVIGGQWHPVPALHALALANRIEAYSLPAGMIGRLFRDMADGVSGHMTRAGLGTSADPRKGGGRLNARTRDDIVHLVRTAGQSALLLRAFPIDVGLIGVGVRPETGDLLLSRESHTIARAVRRAGGIVIAQPLPPHGRSAPIIDEPSDTLIDVLVAGSDEQRAP